MIVSAAPPPDGGYLVLNEAQIGNWELVCLIKQTYRHTKIIAQQRLELITKSQSGKRNAVDL